MEKNKLFVCECGKEFTNPQSFNGHKCHCKEHLSKKYKNSELGLDNLNKKRTEHNKETNKKLSQKYKKIKEDKLNKGISEKHVCEHCGKVMTEKYGSGRFCCRTCANSRIRSASVKLKISNKLKLTNKDKVNSSHEKSIEKYYENPRICPICGKPIPYEIRYRKTCSLDCKKILLQESGKKSAYINRNNKRSHNEIYFYKLCRDYFSNVLHNEPIFNGGDADIILPDLNIAILGNGPGHYRMIMKNQNSSLKQIQTRDKLKQDEIKKAGYIPYIIKDMGLSEEEVEKEFNILLDFIKNNCIR